MRKMPFFRKLMLYLTMLSIPFLFCRSSCNPSFESHEDHGSSFLNGIWMLKGQFQIAINCAYHDPRLAQACFETDSVSPTGIFSEVKKSFNARYIDHIENDDYRPYYDLDFTVVPDKGIEPGMVSNAGCIYFKISILNQNEIFVEKIYYGVDGGNYNLRETYYLNKKLE